MTPPASPGRDLIKRLDAGGGPQAELRRRSMRLRLRSADHDRLGVLVEALEVDRLPGAVQADVLRQRLLQFVEKVDYLSEPLRLVEHDPTRTGALLRSAQVRLDGDHREYFEVRVERNRDTTLGRWRQPPDSGERSAVPFLLTRDILARLVDDLAAALRA